MFGDLNIGLLASIGPLVKIDSTAVVADFGRPPPASPSGIARAEVDGPDAGK